MKNNTFKRLSIMIFNNNKKEIIIVLIAIILTVISSLTVPLSLKVIIDDYIIPLINIPNPDFSNFYKIMSVIAIIFLIGSLSSLVYSLLMVKITHKTLKELRDEMFKKMQSFPISYFDNNKTGNIMSIYSNDADVLRQAINQSFPSITQSILGIIVSLVSMTILSPLLSLLSILMIISLVFITNKISKKTGMFFASSQKNIANITGFLEERMNGQRVIKVFSYEDISKNEFNELNEELYSTSSKANIYANLLAPIIGNIGLLQFVLTAILASLLYINNIGGLTIGVIIAYLQLTKSFTQPFMQMAMQLNSIVMALAGAERIFQLLDNDVEIDEGKVILVNINKVNDSLIETSENTNLWAWKKEDGTLIELKGDVRLENMSFSYDGKKTVLDDISIYAKPGQKLAFVGATGAGKTTITNLINRFYEINKGKIIYDGINIKDIKKTDLRKSLGVVLQDTKLFSGTIMENIRYGKLEASDDEVYEAAKLAHADHFIRMLPNGYNTVLSSSAEELSIGQKQLIAIARVAISNPPVLILDEATSNIDTRTEKLVQNGMDNLMKNRTVFVIAHRLSTIRNSNAIIVLENGKISERGSHKELLNNKGIYYQLYTGNIELD